VKGSISFLMASVALACAWALSGCGSDSLGGTSCRINQDCAAGQQCVGGQCRGATTVGCKNDEACDPGEYCDRADGLCKTMEVVGCTADEQCAPAQRCNTLTGVCITGRRTCTSEAQCSAIGKHCDLNLQQCVDCVDGSHCGNGQSCVQNQCVDPEPGGCASDAACGAPARVCEATQCVPGCAQPGSPIACGLGNVCNTNTGRCEPGQVTCSSDVQCGPPSSICESGQCIPGCAQVGGLVCTGGWSCNPSNGRCEPPAGCALDSQCGAPAGICENQRCVPGCGQPGGTPCATGTACDTGTGRCVAVSGPCQRDAQCSPPNRICESGQCIPGCAQPGGIQCAGNTVCEPSTGRCVSGGGPGCTSNAQCSPPATFCSLASGTCVAGCGSTGCAAGQTCNQSTGQCQGGGGGGGGGGLPLNAICTGPTTCASGVCFDFGSTIGSRCIQSCGSSADCPSSFTCYDYSGGKMCVSSQLFPGASFAGQPGSVCTEGGQCRSNFCPANQCAETCSDSVDCGGAGCRWSEFSPGAFVAACMGPAGGGGNGAPCSADTQCASGVCYGTGVCGDLCGSSADCPFGTVCAPVNYSVCALDLGVVCLDWNPYLAKTCVQAPHGSTPMGGACSDPSGSNCRDGFCLGMTNQCTGLCARDADCPASMVCSVEVYGDLDGEPVFVNICVPR
jgi:hypothetical protein